MASFSLRVLFLLSLLLVLRFLGLRASLVRRVDSGLCFLLRCVAFGVVALELFRCGLLFAVRCVLTWTTLFVIRDIFSGRNPVDMAELVSEQSTCFVPAHILSVSLLRHYRGRAHRSGDL